MNTRSSCTSSGLSMLGRATGLCALLGAAAVTQASPTVSWMALSPGGDVDAGLRRSCGQNPIMRDAAGNLLVARAYAEPTQGFLSIAKFDPDGAPLWRMDDRGPGRIHDFESDYQCLAAIDGAGDVVVLSAGLKAVNGRRDVVTAKYRGSDGLRLWVARTDSITPVNLLAIGVDPAGDVWVMGSGLRLPPNNYGAAMLVKYRGTTGVPDWTGHERGEVFPFGLPYSLAIDAQGNGVLASVFAASKIAGATGTPMWSGPQGVVQLPSSGATSGSSVPHGVKIDAAGDVLILRGDQAPGAGNTWSRDFIAVKLFGATGAPAWTLPGNLARYQGPAGDDWPTALALDPAGNLIMHGSSHGGGTSTAHYDYATVSLDGATGARRWNALPAGAARYNGPAAQFDSASAVVTDAAGDVYASGTLFDADGRGNIATRKYSGSSGEPLWSGLADFSAVFDSAGGGNDESSGLLVDGSGGVLMLGRVEGENDDQRLVRLDAATGAPTWSAQNEPLVPSHERAEARRAVAVDGAGNTFVAGTRFNGDCEDWLVMKVSPEGQRLWSRTLGERRVNGSYGCGAPTALALDAQGDVLVTGFLGWSAATAKLSGVDGQPAWTGLAGGLARFFGHGPGLNIAHFVAVDAAGDAVVVAGAHPANGNYSSSVYTLKYAGATGAPRWTALADNAARFGPSYGYIPAGLAIDPQGDVVVTSTAPSQPNAAGIATIKYSGLDGAPLWTGLPGGAARFGGLAPVLALDPAGDVLVAATVGVPPQREIATLKYSGASGAPMWNASPDGSVRWNGGLGDDVPATIASDSVGNVYVAGESTQSGGNADWATLKYAGSDGSPLWSGVARREDAGGADRPTTLALLRNDVVAVLGSQAPATGATTGWVSYDARSGMRLHGESAPAGTVWTGATFGSDGMLRLTGTQSQGPYQRVLVTGVTGISETVFRSSFEVGE